MERLNLNANQLLRINEGTGESLCLLLSMHFLQLMNVATDSDEQYRYFLSLLQAVDDALSSYNGKVVP